METNTDTREHLLELRSNEAEDLLSRRPSRTLRWGISIIFTILCLLFLCAWFVHYPDLVTASLKLTSVNSPKSVYSRVEGKIIAINLKEGVEVKAGVPIAFMESSGNHTEVLNLQETLSAIKENLASGKVENISPTNLDGFTRLGELQSAYQTFMTEFHQLQYYKQDGYYAKRINLLKHEIEDLELIEQNLRGQKDVLEKDRRIADEDLTIQNKLAREQVLTPLELKREESKNISKQLPTRQAELAILNNSLAKRAKQQEILEIEKTRHDSYNKLNQSLNTIQNLLEEWKSKYILSAPMDGYLHMPITLQENQFIKAGTELFFVSPNIDTFIGELNIPQENFGKVQVDQTVLIKFPAYPFQEYGSVTGRLTEISTISFKENNFQAKVSLPHGLLTNYQKRLSYKNGMIASAEIITEDSNLLQKLFYQLRKVLQTRRQTTSATNE